MPYPVEITWHAVEQFRTRFPLESGAASQIRLLISVEVGEAMLAGRYATKQPRWSGRQSRGRRNGKEIDRTLRYCWTEDQRRLYLVDKGNDVARVITAIRPDGSIG